MEELDGATTAHLFNGRPVRNLDDWLRTLAKRQRTSLSTAAGMVVQALAAEGGNSLLVLTRTRDPYPVPGSWAPISHRAASPVVPRIQRSNGRVHGNPFACIGAEVRSQAVTGAKCALALLKAHWSAELAADRDSALDVVPALGAGLGVTEDDALRLWPVLVVAPPVLTAVEGISVHGLAIKRAPNDAWTDVQRAELLRYVEARRLADPRQKVGALLDDVAATCFVSVSNIKAQLAKARKLAEKGQGHAGKRTA
ncbi:hypothetical protein PEC18_11750 [Paucibacter sp. O1-1]|nr:hypothetical protein [Paucibacter sp. O1-1]MDA3826497.1 hypothetical protein [Paucibacter sp. O1-1]